jgi:hypothetical protein
MQDGCPDFATSASGLDENLLLKTALLDLFSGEKDLSVPLKMLEGYDMKSFEAGYKAYEQMLFEWLRSILGQN